MSDSPQPARSLVLVEGESDRAALLATVAALGREVETDGLRVEVLGGATGVGGAVRRLVDDGEPVEVRGLCDEAEEGWFRRAFETLGAAGPRPGALAVCRADLEDELIRATGADAVIHLIEKTGESSRWLSFVRQPAQRSRSPEQQLHRFLGTRAGRKIEYARLLVEALPPSRIPAPLRAVLVPRCAREFEVGSPRE